MKSNHIIIDAHEANNKLLIDLSSSADDIILQTHKTKLNQAQRKEGRERNKLMFRNKHRHEQYKKNDASGRGYKGLYTDNKKDVFASKCGAQSEWIVDSIRKWEQEIYALVFSHQGLG